MKKIATFLITLFLLTSELLAENNIKENENISIKTFNISDEQELYNSLKKIFFSSEHKNILDSGWRGLHMSKRVTSGFIDIDVEVQNVVLSSKPIDKNGTKEFTLEIFTTQNDEVTHFKPDSFLHRLFWNRLEFILGLEDEWIDCHHMFEALGQNNHLLCSPNEQKALQEVKVEK
ncbi:MAG: hypothetical protein M0Q24_00290 [Sulfurimonas sp.]|uniref:hypothetical protein n=1 Tax=Sulfurimonas sp. TaxID=2022749 RepID=UPI0025D5C4C8|nr:hypothetical protein [Sulfurimonas sp.]MCK9490498.1 hypothetical protein [Sulfurimonas sp.]